jgi:L-ascorbate 6-phosphate lactonase
MGAEAGAGRPRVQPSLTGSVSLTWLGQSGFAVTAPEGDVCLVDPYLSDYVEQELGTPRVAPIVLDPSATVAQLIVSSHWHPDHLDRPTCCALAQTNPEAYFVGPPSNEPRLKGWGVDAKQIVCLGRGESISFGAFTVRGEFARHEVPGFLSEDALSLVIEVGGIRIFHSGDTEYDARVLAAHRGSHFDVGLFVINGSGGNMNASEAALLAHQLQPDLAVPMHYGMWALEGYGPGATLDPESFSDLCARLGGPATRILELGETIELTGLGS